MNTKIGHVADHISHFVNRELGIKQSMYALSFGPLSRIIESLHILYKYTKNTAYIPNQNQQFYLCSKLHHPSSEFNFI